MTGARPRVILVGMMGAGKSTVGTALTERTGWPYLDNDELLERATGIDARTLAQRGEVELRAAESAALTEALRTPAPVVASVAAGVVEAEADRARLRAGGFVVWLRARIETLASRVGTGEHRPWLQPDPVAALRRLYAGRPEKYAEVAAYVIDVDDLPVGEVADRILSALRAAGEPAGPTPR